MLDKMGSEELVDGRLLPKPPPTPRRCNAPPREAVRGGGALVRTYDEDDSDGGEQGEAAWEGEKLVESTRAMFSTLLDGHSSIMQGHMAIESEITRSHSHSRGLHQTAQDLHARIEALEDEMEQMQARAAAREREIERKLAAASARSRHAADADELARRIEEQIERASVIQDALGVCEHGFHASLAERLSEVAGLQAAQQECKELHKEVHAAKERAQKLAKALESEKDKSRTLSAHLADAEERNKELTRQVHDLEMELQTKSEELELMFKASEKQRREQRKEAEAEQERRGELEDKVGDLRAKIDTLQESRDKLKGKVDALTKELQTANEAWDTKWNQENWAKQCAEKQLSEQKRHSKNIESQLADLLKENRELKQMVKQLKDAVGLASTIDKIRKVDVSKDDTPVGFDAVLDRVANVRRYVDDLESSKKSKSISKKR